MAQTYTVMEALNLGTRGVAKTNEDNYAAYIANNAQSLIWNKYDWRETIKQLPPFYLVPNEQEFGPPAAIIPSDFQGLREAYITNISGSPPRRQELKVRRDVRLTAAQGLPVLMSYEPSTKRFRVFPRVPAGIGPTDWIVDGTYKTRPTKLTTTTLNALVPWDDLYFQVYVAAIKWAALSAAGDPRAGQVQYQQGGGITYTGQLAEAHALIDEMAAQEGLELGDPTLAPSEALVYPTNYGFLYPSVGSF